MNMDYNFVFEEKFYELLKFIEYENSKCKYDFEDIEMKLFLKNLLNKLHEIRILFEANK